MGLHCAIVVPSSLGYISMLTSASLTCSGFVMFKKRYQDYKTLFSYLFFAYFPNDHRKSKVTTVSCSIRINFSSMYSQIYTCLNEEAVILMTKAAY